MNRPKQNSGPRTTTFEKKPKSRSLAHRVWTTAHSVYGRPPSWMRMIPARRYFTDETGKERFSHTTRWEIDIEGKGIIVLEGPAKKVVEEMAEGV